jgi:hypothetical protein
MSIPQRVVSLGSNCMVTKEMRTFFGVQSANLFDWWITPGDALVRLIESDFEDLFSASNLRIVGRQASVANLRYGILHHHDFRRTGAEDRVLPISDADLQRNCDKFAYLKRRWDDLADNPTPVLFIRFAWNTPANPLLANLPPEPTNSSVSRLLAALDRKFPKLDYQLLLIDAPEITLEPATLENPRVLYRDSSVFTEPGQYLDAANLVRPDNAEIFSRIFATVTLR